jgi:hypothetical protein
LALVGLKAERKLAVGIDDAEFDGIRYSLPRGLRRAKRPLDLQQGGSHQNQAGEEQDERFGVHR